MVVQGEFMGDSGGLVGLFIEKMEASGEKGFAMSFCENSKHVMSSNFTTRGFISWEGHDLNPHHLGFKGHLSGI